MNRCTQLDGILHEGVPRQRQEFCLISRSYVKCQGHMSLFGAFLCAQCGGYPRAVLSQGLIILFLLID